MGRAGLQRAWQISQVQGLVGLPRRDIQRAFPNQYGYYWPVTMSRNDARSKARKGPWAREEEGP